MFTHIVRESIVTKLKHVVILGYVIGCDIRKLNNNTGLRQEHCSQLSSSKN